MSRTIDRTLHRIEVAELLYTPILVVGQVQVPSGVHSNIVRKVELAVSGTREQASDRQSNWEISACTRELLSTIIEKCRPRIRSRLSQRIDINLAAKNAVLCWSVEIDTELVSLLR